MSCSLFIEKTISTALGLTDQHLNTRRMLVVSSQYEARQLAMMINDKKVLTTSVKAGDLFLSAVLTDFYGTAISEYMKDLKKIHDQASLTDLIQPGMEGAWSSLLNRMDIVFPSNRTTGLDAESSRLETRVTDALVIKFLNRNAGCTPLNPLFCDLQLQGKIYNEIIEVLDLTLASFPRPPLWEHPLTEVIQKPSDLFPDSLEDQIRYISSNYSFIKNKTPYLRALDLSREENKIGLTGPGPVEGIDFSFPEDDSPRFSIDSDWMPNLILLAKNCYVWLHQLSEKYRRPIQHLNDIPGEELDEIRRRGITGLWLIGIWERSTASKTIKRKCGNPEAEASAYSLKNYMISGDLGGWEAFHDLKERCLQKGIRLASDMVPNHTGLDSDWMVEHPDFFLQAEKSPYPNYTFNGPDLSPDLPIGLYLEDGYYNQSDAAVVFLREDRKSGEKSYIYHGNDGTSMPWNDTAQLDFMNPEVREEIIQQILHVAENFPIVRFDAAMTLARKHIQRLWYPRAGEGGAIPSRSEHSMTDEEFRTHMPEEFWREVVDRINSESPNTLLLAEAFWMMEGYFVRNLGMHRVYNSAFMNLLKTENNKEYRKILKETLKTNPRILKRFVNFMNNPDEETAVSQFGKGDKYFGICTLLVTLPGLPMIGHGQFEGLTEKYGMEYRRSYFNEEPDHELLRRHEREIYPLMKKRILFAGAKQFHLYDFMTESAVNDNVYAYSNSRDGDHALILYNNSNTLTQGSIHLETEKGDDQNEDETSQLEPGTLGSILKLEPEGFTLLFETKKRLWYIRRNSSILKNGLNLKLYGYQTKVFYPIRQQSDDEERRLEKLILKIGDRGIPDLDRAIKYSELEPLIYLLKTFLDSRVIDTPVMSDLITQLSKNLMRVRKIVNGKSRALNKRPLRQEVKVLEGIIRPSFLSLMLSEPNDGRLFYMARFFQIWTETSIRDIESVRRIWQDTIHDEIFSKWFGMNQYRDIIWFNKESMDEVFWWFSILSCLTFVSRRSSEADYNNMKALAGFLGNLQKSISESEYRVSQILV